MEKKEKKINIFNYFMFFVGIIIVYRILSDFGTVMESFKSFLGIISPFLTAILVAYLLYIPSKKIEKLYFKITKKEKIARISSIITVYAIIFLTLYFAISWLLPFIIDSASGLVDNLPSYITQAETYLDTIPEDSFLGTLNLSEHLQDFINIDYIAEITNRLSVENITEQISRVFGVANAIFDMFVTIIVSIYILYFRVEIYEYFTKIVDANMKKRTGKKVKRYISKTNFIFYNFLTAQLLDAVIMAVLAVITLLALKVKHALPLGILIGVFNLIPYFGAIIAVGLAAILTIFTGGISQAIVMLIAITIVQQIDANIINPKILGDNLDLNPIFIIVAVTLGGAYFGPIGMFLGVPVLAVIIAIFDEMVTEKLENKRKVELIYPKKTIKFSKDKNMKKKNLKFNKESNRKYRKEEFRRKARLKQEKENKQNKENKENKENQEEKNIQNLPNNKNKKEITILFDKNNILEIEDEIFRSQRKRIIKEQNINKKIKKPKKIIE